MAGAIAVVVAPMPHWRGLVRSVEHTNLPLTQSKAACCKHPKAFHSHYSASSHGSRPFAAQLKKSSFPMPYTQPHTPSTSYKASSPCSGGPGTQWKQRYHWNTEEKEQHDAGIDTSPTADPREQRLQHQEYHQMANLQESIEYYQ